jgi:hypothetical protein
MSAEGAQQRFIISDNEGGQSSRHHEIVKLERCEVGEGVGLGMTPDQFDRVEFGAYGGSRYACT